VTWFDYKAKADKKKSGGSKDSIDPARSKERSWNQSRTVALLIEEFPSGNGFTDEDWSRCYKQAKEEWEKQHK